MELARGQIWWADPAPTIGREQSGRHPVLVVANDDYHQQCAALTIVVPITKRDRDWTNHVPITGPHELPADCFAMTEQLRCISRDRLVKAAGRADEDCLAAVLTYLHDFLA